VQTLLIILLPETRTYHLGKAHTFTRTKFARQYSTDPSSPGKFDAELQALLKGLDVAASTQANAAASSSSQSTNQTKDASGSQRNDHSELLKIITDLSKLSTRSKTTSCTYFAYIVYEERSKP